VKSDSQFDNLNLPSVSIVKTIPKISEEDVFLHKLCYIGISLENPLFQGSSLEALLLWGITNFDKCLVVVGDYLRRYNEHILYGLENDAALKAALGVGDAFMLRTNKLFQKFDDEKIQLARWKQCLDTVEYERSKAVLDELFACEPDFKASVQKDAFSFAKRQTKRKSSLAVPMEEAIDISCEYLLEEIAVFSALSEQGWKVELYPGPELHVLADIAKGIFPNIPQGLKERVNVELHISHGKAE